MTEANPNPQILELHIEGFKSIKDQTIPLQPLTILIGANGAGKSNLVQFISMLGHMQTGSFQRWVGMRGWANNLLHFGSKVTPTMKARVDFQTGSGRNYYSFELTANNNDELMIWNEMLGYQRKGTKDYFHVDLNNDGGKESYFSVIQPGDHVLGMTDAQIKTASVIGRFLRKFQAYQFHDTTPEARIRQSTEPHLNLFLGNNGGNLAGWLHRLFHMKNSQSYSMIESTVRHAFPDFGGFDLIEDPLNGKTQFLWHHRHHEGLFRATHLSDGTIRFIALCALFLQPIEFIPDVLLIDEPELGLHPTALLILASMARNVVAQGKQVILTTQSPKLLSQFDPKNVVVVERENEASTFKSVSDMGIPLEEWLEKYDGLGSLWEMNLLGGTP